MRFSIELVPRSRPSLERDLSTLRAAFPGVDTVNIPDLVRFPLRSWHACGIARGSVAHAIPHVRARDFQPHALEGLKEALAGAGLRELLVVRGDPRNDPQVAEHPTTSAELIRALKAADPSLRVHAALDPYRQSMRAELDDVIEKVDAGADGFFTQPIFDLRVAEWWADALGDREVWWGASAILTPSSRRYWERKNRVVLPRDFEPGLDWSRRQTAALVDWVRRVDGNAYAMPIRVDLLEWLGGIV